MRGQSGVSSPDGSQPEAPQLLDSALTVKAVVPLLDKYPGPGPRPWVMTHGFPLVPPLPRLSHVESPPCKSPFLYFHSRPLHAPLRPEPASSALAPPQMCSCLLLSQGGSVWWVPLFHQLPVGAVLVSRSHVWSGGAGALRTSPRRPAGDCALLPLVRPPRGSSDHPAVSRCSSTGNRNTLERKETVSF